jgi:CheY-like chemotaxis protein
VQAPKDGPMNVKIASESHVVMVDDNPGDVVFARECFVLSGVENPWLSLGGGAELLALLAAVKAGDETMPALVLLDINMPRMSGHEVLERVRDDSFFEQLPIFCMLTSSSDPRDRERAIACGASGFLVKPDNPADYVAFFQSLV